MIPVETLATHLDEAHVAIRTAVTNEAAVRDRVSEATRTLKSRRAQILNDTEDPKTLGSNEAARTAKILELTQDEEAHKESLEHAAHQAGTATMLAQLELDRLKTHVRLHEVLAAATR